MPMHIPDSMITPSTTLTLFNCSFSWLQTAGDFTCVKPSIPSCPLTCSVTTLLQEDVQCHDTSSAAMPSLPSLAL